MEPIHSGNAQLCLWYLDTPTSLVAPLRCTDAAGYRGLTFKTTMPQEQVPSSAVSHEQVSHLTLPSQHRLGHGRAVLWGLASLGLEGQGWPTAIPQGTAATSHHHLQFCSSPPAAAATCVPSQLGPVRSPGNTGLHCWLHWCADLVSCS